jgi:1,4-alpha-glucan branching enzyme
MRELADGGDLALSTPGEYLHAHPIQQKAMPAPTTWGKNGFNEHWINQKTEYMWRPLHESAARMRQAVTHHQEVAAGSVEDRVLRQAGRELMLAQSSDWPFIITNGTTEEYARRRFQDHLNRFHFLLDTMDSRQVDVRALEALETMDAIFPELDYRLFA